MRKWNARGEQRERLEEHERLSPTFTGRLENRINKIIIIHSIVKPRHVEGRAEGEMSQRDRSLRTKKAARNSVPSNAQRRAGNAAQIYYNMIGYF